MISMVETLKEDYVNENPFPGMSLAEACAELELLTNQAINEFQINTLLVEHAYLYENGVEISYVDEAGSLNEKGERMIQGLKTTIDKVSRWVAEAWDKLITWVADAAQGLVEKMKKVGINKKELEKAASAFDTVYPDGCKLSVTKIDQKFFDDYKKWYQNGSGNNTEYKDPGTLNIYSKYVHGKEDEVITSFHFNAAKVSVLNNNAKSMINDIKVQKNDANKALYDLRSSVKSTMKNDNDGQSIKMYNELIRANSKICRESIRVWHAYVSKQIAIVYGVINGAPMRKYLANDTKAEIKGKVDNAKASAVNTGEKIARKIDKNYDAKKYRKSKEYLDDIEGMEESANDVYNGRFFRT